MVTRQTSALWAGGFGFVEVEPVSADGIPDDIYVEHENGDPFSPAIYLGRS